MFHALFELPMVTLRPSYVYGPHQRDASKLVPHVVTSLLADVSPGLSTGGRTMDWLYAGDAAAAFRAALEAEGVEGHTLDVSSGDRRSVREVVELLHRIIAPPSADVGFGDLPTRRYDFDLSSGDPTSTRALLGWAPAISLQRGLELTIDWFRAGCPEASTS
jgi:nucleoside-diphosphate-sugar epimerase